MARSKRARIREFSPSSDLESIYEMYRTMESAVPYQPRTRFAQFARDLRVNWIFPSQHDYDGDADIALVAVRGGEVVAYCDGCLVKKASKGSALSGQAFIRMVIGKPEHAESVQAVVGQVTRHLLKCRPDGLSAFNPQIAPAFCGYSCGLLHEPWAWLGQCLSNEGYRADAPHQRMYRPLRGRGVKSRVLPIPSVDVEASHQIPGEGLRHLESKYILCHSVRGALCENYYSGAFVKGSGYRYLFTHWITSAPEYRRQGLARKLLRQGLISAYEAGAKGATLVTEFRNFIAYSLYRSEGYSTVDNLCSFTYQGQ